MDRVQQEVTSIRSDLQNQINRAVHEAKTELRTEFAAMLHRKVVSLEARVEAKANEIRQDSVNWVEEELVLAIESLIPPPSNPMTTSPTSFT